MSVSTIDRYDNAESYEWNYQHAPVESAAPALAVPAMPGNWTFCGLPVASPLGIPAGPLLNSRWIRYYAQRGFDVLTYKTVRSRFRESYGVPNLLPVDPSAILTGEGSELNEAPSGELIASWAISFGMPSREPTEWRADVALARRALAPGQILSVSVVASPEPGWGLNELSDDFATCAEWAADAGAHVVEANLSCPNVCSQEADLYLSPEAAGEIAALVRARLPREVPLVLKIGLFQSEAQAEAVLRAVDPFAQAVSTTNSISAMVKGRFGGLRRGIGGGATTARCLQELAMLARLVRSNRLNLRLIGVGGVMTAKDVRNRLQAGAEHVQLATAPMVNPQVALQLRKELARS